MRNPILRSWLVLLLAVSFSGQTSEWKKYKSTDGNLAVLFPGDPQDSINPTGEGTMRSHTLLVQAGGGVYTVVYTAMDTAQPVDDATFQVFKKAVFNELPKCDVQSEKAPAPALDGYIGHWYRLECAMPARRVSVEGNLYWGKHYAYAVMVMFPSDAARPDGASKFLGSFSVIEPSK
jgi:hypothetical protein